MKKLALLVIAIVFAFGSFAQDNSVKAIVNSNQVTTLSANLKTTLVLQLDKSPVTFEFVTLNDYQYGLGISGGYTSKGAISSTSNWNLSVKANTKLQHTDGSTTMPIDNIGLSVKYIGSKPIKNNTTNGPLALSYSEKMLIGHNGTDSNAGDFSENEFIINWEMGTQRGDMNKESLLTQDLKRGTYSTQIEFIASEVPK